MNDRNLYQKAKAARREEKVALRRYGEMLSAMEEEIDAVTKPIEEKYEDTLVKLEKEFNKKGALNWNMGYLYSEYSEFKEPDILAIIIMLLNYVEGEHFTYLCSGLCSSDCLNGFFFILKEETVIKHQGNLSYDIVYDNSIRIGGTLFNRDKIRFYDRDGKLLFNSSLYSYLYEFINKLIQYRIDNNLRDEISYNRLYSFLRNFLLTHPELTQKNKDKREQMLSQSCQKGSIEERSKRLIIKLKQDDTTK